MGSNKATQEVFKTCAAFNKCVTKTNGSRTDDAEDLSLSCWFIIF